MPDVLKVSHDGQRYLVHPRWWMRLSDDCASAALGGDIDYDGAPVILELLSQCLNTATSDLCVDLTKVGCITASVLGALDCARQLALSQGQDLELRVRAGSTVEYVVHAALGGDWSVQSIR